MEAAQKALSVAEKFLNNNLISYAAWTLSLACTLRGDLSRGIEYGELAVQRAVTPSDKAFGQGAVAWAWCRPGEPNRGIELLIALLPIFRGRFMPSEIPHTCSLGEGYWLAGENDKARQALEGALKVAERCGARYYLGWAQRLLGEIALKTKSDQATAHFEKSVAVCREINAENELALAYAGYGRFYKQQGQFAQAQEYLMKGLEILERLGILLEPDKVKGELDGLLES